MHFIYISLIFYISINIKFCASALKDIATDNEIEKSGNINILQFRDEIVKVQDEATIKMAKSCPDFAPKKTYLTEVSRQN